MKVYLVKLSVNSGGIKGAFSALLAPEKNFTKHFNFKNNKINFFKHYILPQKYSRFCIPNNYYEVIRIFHLCC